MLKTLDWRVYFQSFSSAPGLYHRLQGSAFVAQCSELSPKGRHLHLFLQNTKGQLTPPKHRATGMMSSVCFYCLDHLEHESPHFNLLFLKRLTSVSPRSLNSHLFTDWCWWERFLQYSVCNLDNAACHCSRKGTIRCDADWRKVWSSLENITYSVSFLVGQGSSEPDTATWLIYGPNLIKLLTKLEVKWKRAHLQDLDCKH